MRLTPPARSRPILRALGLVLTVAGLAACEVRTGPAAGTTVATGPSAAGATTASSIGPSPASASGAAYTALDGCYRFTPAAGWTKTKEATGATTFTVVAETATEPALEVETACSPLDKVGGDGPIDLPNGKLLTDERVPFGGAKGRRITYRLTVKSAPPYVLDSWSVDRNGVRCVFGISGLETQVQAHRAEFDAAVATLACLGS